MIRRPPRSTLFPYTTLFRSKLEEAFWPGPLTMVVPSLDIVPKVTTGGLNTVAIRMPEDETARALIKVSGDRKSTRLNSSHANISYAVFCLKKKKQINTYTKH